MLSKVLLPLVVCFQVLCIEDWWFRAVRVDVIENDWKIGESVDVKINTYSHEDSSCKISFRDDRGDAGDYLLVSFSGPSQRLVINSRVNGKWQSEDSYNGIKIPHIIPVTVEAEESGFKITFKGKEYFRRYEFPLESIKYLVIHCPGNEAYAIADVSWNSPYGAKKSHLFVPSW